MLTSKDCLAKYGDPEKEHNMVVWQVPPQLYISSLPSRIYCNKDLVEPLRRALTQIYAKDIGHQIKTWDGCFNIRQKRGALTPSLHSWGVAIDINAAWNPFGKQPFMSDELVNCFTDAGFDWGGHWSTPDGMHFQLRSIA